MGARGQLDRRASAGGVHENEGRGPRSAESMPAMYGGGR